MGIMPKLLSKKNKSEDLVDEEVEELKRKEAEKLASYRPTTINQDEIDDIGDQLADKLMELFEKHGTDPIPGDKPIDLLRADELTSIAVTQQHVGFLLMKQQECDKLTNEPWFVKYMPLMLLIGGAFIVAALILVLGNYALSMLH